MSKNGCVRLVSSNGDDFVEVGKTNDFTEGEGRCFSINGQKIAVFKHKDRFGAIANSCIHQGGSLADGVIVGDNVQCPLHGWEYDLISGKGPNRFAGEDVTAYTVKVEDDTVWVSIRPMTGIELKLISEEKEYAYLEEWARGYDEYEGDFYHLQKSIQQLKSETSAMGTTKPFIGWDTILFKGGQLFRPPLNEDEPVSTKTIIGKPAEHPLELDIPFYVSHMSYGALSREAKIALAKGSTLVGTAMCSGEGGMLPEEREESSKYIYELGTAMFSHQDEAIKQADAVEIKIGQAAKTGLGGHLPASKITPEIAKIRGVEMGQDVISPGRHADISSIVDLQREVDHIRELIGGKPVGIKFAAAHIEEDLEFALQASPDFITIDTRGGGTGAAPTYIKDNIGIPAIYAITRARKYLDSVNSNVTLCVTGGFRSSADISKALALGADAVALATFALVGIGCQRYRSCHTGNCPVGIATQDEKLRARFDIEKSTTRLYNLFKLTKEEVENFARINGRDDVHKLDLTDVVTSSDDVAKYTPVNHF